MSLRTAHIHHLDVAGVDIIQSNRGPLLLEINASPGLEGIETVTQKDVATEIVSFLEKQYEKHQRRQKRQKKK